VEFGRHETEMPRTRKTNVNFFLMLARELNIEAMQALMKNIIDGLFRWGV
jgi:hypothetical protein